jgi:hypothetical protein
MFNLNGDDLEGLVGEYGDEAPYLIETVGAGQEPEYDEERRLILGLEAQLEDLTYLMADIRRAGGMCQDFATEAFRLVPALESMGGVGYYTKTPSKTRLTVAMEELHKGIYAAIAAAAAVVMFAIYRFIRWLTGDKSEDSGTNATNPPDATKVKDKANDAKKKIADKYVKADIVADAEVKVADTLQTVQNKVDEAHPNTGDHSGFDMMYTHFASEGSNEGQKRFLKLINGEYADILQNGDWTRNVEKLAGVMGAIKTQLINRFKTFEQITEHVDRGDVTDQSKIQHEVSSLKKPIGVAGYHTGADDLGSLANFLKDVRKRAQNTSLPKNSKLNLRKTLEQLNHKKKNGAFEKFQHIEERFPEEMAEIATYQDKIRKVLVGKGNPMLDGHPNGLPAEYARELGGVARQLQADFLDYLQICGQISYYTQSVIDCGSEVMGLITANYKSVKAFMVEQGMPVPEEMDEAVRYIHQTAKHTKSGMNFWGKRAK